MTSISLLSCLVTCSRTVSSPVTTIVIREVDGSSVGPTFNVSILKPRPLNIPAMRVSTPNLFSTRTDIVWRIKKGRGVSTRPAGESNLKLTPRAGPDALPIHLISPMQLGLYIDIKHGAAFADQPFDFVEENVQ